MSNYLVHQGAMVQCTHQAPAQPVVTSRRVKVGGQAIVTRISNYTISGCPNPPQSGGPCATALWTSAATRVTSEKSPVVLKDSQSKCAPNGTTLVVISTQMRVKGT